MAAALWPHTQHFRRPTNEQTRSALGRAHVPPTKVFRQLVVKWQLLFVSKRGSN